MSLGSIDVVGPEISLEAWVRPDQFSHCSSSDCRIVSKASGTAAGDHWWVLSTIDVEGETRLSFGLRVDSTAHTLVADRGDLAVGDWAHVAATFDGSTMALYLNSTLVGAQTVPSGRVAVNPSIEAFVGASPPEPGSKSWNGAIDEVRIWDHARTPAELAGFADHELVGDHVGLVAAWSFNRDEQVAFDHTGTATATRGAGPEIDLSDPIHTFDRALRAAPLPAAIPVDTTTAGPTGPSSDGSATWPKPTQASVGPRVPITRFLTADQAIDELRRTSYLSATHITGSLTFEGTDGVGWVIEDSVIEADGRYAVHAYKSRTAFAGTPDQRPVLRYVTLAGAAPLGGQSDAVVYGTDIVIDHADIYGANDGIKPYGQFTITNSWIRDLDHPDGAHADAIQIRSGTGIVIQGNRIDAYIGYSSDNTYDKVGGTANGALQTGSVSGPIHAIWANNYFAGGHYTIRSSDDPRVNYIFTDNVWMQFGTSIALNTTTLAPNRWGPLNNVDYLDPSNTWEHTGDPVFG